MMGARRRNAVLLVALVLALVSALCSGAHAARPPFRKTATWDANKLKELSDQLSRQRVESDIRDFLAIGTRMPDTAGIRAARHFIVERLRAAGWVLTYDTSRQSTPIGKIKFTTIIATWNPEAKTKTVLSAHYDSKYYTEFEFLGATDSAVPCMILVELARVLGPMHENSKEYRRGTGSHSLQLVFYDGEEAYKEWTATDSLYGSRHLANKWQRDGTLDNVDVLVLLDLIGHRGATFHMQIPTTAPLHQALVGTEQRMKLGTTMFRAKQGPYIGDDHEPFMKKGVPCLHIVSYPFPKVWHQQGDDLSVVDFEETFQFTKIFTAWTAQYMDFALEAKHADDL